MPTEINEISEEQSARIPGWIEDWVKIGTSTEPADFEKAKAAVIAAYKICEKPQPRYIMTIGSPLSAVYAGPAMLYFMSVIETPLFAKNTRQKAIEMITDLAVEIADEIGQLKYEGNSASMLDMLNKDIQRVTGPIIETAMAERYQLWYDKLEIGPKVSKAAEREGLTRRDMLTAPVIEHIMNTVYATVKPELTACLSVPSLMSTLKGSYLPKTNPLYMLLKKNQRGAVDRMIKDALSQDDRLVDYIFKSILFEAVGGYFKTITAQNMRDSLSNLYQGQFYALWASQISFFRDVMHLENPMLDRFKIDEDLVTSCGYVWWHKDVALISDRPKACSRDDQGRLHCETGPTIEYRDGWKVWHWHGTTIPGNWIDKKETLTAKIALTWPQIEQRRIACEILGWNKILDELGGVEINVDPDPQIGTLIEVSLPDAGQERFLRVKCGTGRDFAIPVPRTVKTALEANALVYDIPPDLLKTKEWRT